MARPSVYFDISIDGKPRGVKRILGKQFVVIANVQHSGGSLWPWGTGESAGGHVPDPNSAIAAGGIHDQHFKGQIAHVGLDTIQTGSQEIAHVPAYDNY